MQHSERPDLATAWVRISEPGASRTHNPLGPQHRAACRAAETNQVFRIGKLDLSLKERQTYLSLLRRWGSIPRRPPRNDIRDIDLLSIQSDCAQHAIKQLPRSSDKWAPDSIFIPSRRFPHEHDP